MARVSILLITVTSFITVALITGMVAYVSPHQNLEIRTWYDLNAIRNDLAGNYTLMNDLDSTTLGYEDLASPSANEGKGWQPIGTFLPWAETTFTGFMGTFNGQGYEIRDLFINRPDELGVGLFGEVGQEGVIKDVGVVNAIVTGNAFVGLFAVVDEEGRIEDIGVVNATVTGEVFVGGLVGDNSGTVSNSYSTASVTGNDYVGGLAGESWGFGAVRKSYSTGSVTGNSSVGGLVGLNYGIVSDSYSTSSVTGNSSVGGLVGENDRSTVTNSDSNGSVSGNFTIGGLAGANDGTVSNSYSTGSVTGHLSVGGLVGANNGTVSNSFWDIQTSGQATSAGGTGKNTTEMEDIVTFSGAGWNITTVALNQPNPAYTWSIVDNLTYPFLSWQS